MEVAQIWADKYWNNTIDDSPYDIMSDLEILAKLLYYGVESPITPVIYNIPMFSNSSKNLVDKKNGGSSSDGGSSNWWDEEPEFILDADWNENEWPLEFDDWWEWVSLLWKLRDQNTRLVQDWRISDGVKALPLSQEVDWYDDLLEWLNSLSLNTNDTEFYSSLCKDQDDSEQEKEILEKDKELVNEKIPDFSKLSDLEYQEIIDYMLDAVDDYSELPEGKEEEIQQNVWDVNSFFVA